MLWRIVSSAAAALFLATSANAVCILGMGSCLPTEPEGQAVLYGRLKGIFVPPYTLATFKKTNGTSGKFNGIEIYEMEFLATVTYPSASLQCQMPLCPELAGQYGVKVDEAQKTVSLAGRILFHQTERGWVGE